jgi:glycolate oxidase iron-sulfur subunit
VLDARARMLVTANPGCLLQISAALERRGEALPTAHTVEMLDASIRGVPVTALLDRASDRAPDRAPRQAEAATSAR